MSAGPKGLLAHGLEQRELAFALGRARRQGFGKMVLVGCGFGQLHGLRGDEILPAIAFGKLGRPYGRRSSNRRRYGQSGGLECLHAFREGPEGAVDAYVLIDAGNRPSGAADHAAVVRLAAPGEAAADDVFLHDVERGPQIAADVCRAAAVQDLFGRDGRGFLAIASDKRGFGKQALFRLGESNRRHLPATVDQAGEVLRDGIGALYYLIFDPALVRHADFLKLFARNHRIGADPADQAAEHLVAGCAIVAIDQDDFGRLASADIIAAPHAQHVLGMAEPAAIARGGLHGKKGFPAFTAKALHDLDGGNVDVLLGPRGVRLTSENGRDDGAQLVVGQRFARGYLAGVVTAERGGKTAHGVGPSLTLARAHALRFGRSENTDRSNYVKIGTEKYFTQPIARRCVPGQSLPIAPTPGRSGGTGESGGAAGAAARAEAVRGRSSRLELAPRPVEMARAWRKPYALPQAFRLTPARWDAIKMAGQPCRCAGSGGRVASATALQLSCNRQPLEIARYCARLQRLQLCASRDARVCVCVDARACRWVVNSATLQPSDYVYIYQLVSGCSAVAARLHLQPAMACSAAMRLALLDWNILAVGYSHRGASTAIIGKTERVRRKSFRVLDCGADRMAAGALEMGAVRLDLDQGAARRGNGGFPPFVRGARGSVGTVMLERLSESIESRRFSGVEHQPVRLTAARWRRAGGLDRAAPGAAHPQRAKLFSAPNQTGCFGFWKPFPAQQSSSIRRRSAKVGGRRRVGERLAGVSIRQTGRGALLAITAPQAAADVVGAPAWGRCQ